MEPFEQKIKERNNLLKSQVESLTGRNELVEVIDTLLKAGVAESDLVEKAKYIRRETDGKGGYKYIYSEPKENKIKTDKVDKKEGYDSSFELDGKTHKTKGFSSLENANDFIKQNKGYKIIGIKKQQVLGKDEKFYHVAKINKSSESDLEKAKADKKQQKKIKKVVDEWKVGSLLDSHGNKITDRKQVLAVALSEAGLSKKE